MHPRNGQQNTAYNHPVTGQKKTMPLQINSKNLHKTWSVKIDAVFIVFLQLLVFTYCVYHDSISANCTYAQSYNVLGF